MQTKHVAKHVYKSREAFKSVLSISCRRIKVRFLRTVNIIDVTASLRCNLRVLPDHPQLEFSDRFRKLPISCQ